MYEEQVFIVVFAAVHARGKPVLQSSTNQWGLHFALISVSVQGCWVTAHVYEEQIFIGVFAVVRA